MTTKTPIERKYEIDAAGKSIGRVATEAAKALMGKTSADYTPHIQSRVTVTVSNAKKLRITERKRNDKEYTHYSGHPGGLKIKTLSSLIARQGHGAAIVKAVQKMLPRNTMLSGRMKRLVITD